MSHLPLGFEVIASFIRRVDAAFGVPIRLGVASTLYDVPIHFTEPNTVFPTP